MPTTVGAVIVATTSAGVLTTASAKPASVAAAETAAIIALAKATGINQLGCPVQWIGMPQSHVIEQMHLLGEEVLPRVRQGL